MCCSFGVIEFMDCKIYIALFFAQIVDKYRFKTHEQSFLKLVYILLHGKKAWNMSLIIDNSLSCRKSNLCLRTQGISQAIISQMGCGQSTISYISRKNLFALTNNGERSKRSIFEMATPKEELPTPTTSNRPLASLTSEIMTSPVSRSTTYRRLWSHDFSSQTLCTKPLPSCKQHKNVYSLNRSTLRGRLKTKSNLSSRMSQNLS